MIVDVRREALPNAKGTAMSFRDNLQSLRATKNMTQEQLAMLLGVSRQSVTKWEAERSYPEMDKLIKICQIFECTLDDLVQGDLTGRAGEGAHAAVPQGPPQDICGYDDHQRKMARMVPTGIALILAFVGIAFLFADSTALGLAPGVLFAAIVLIGVVLVCAFTIPAGMEHNAFVKAHPYIEDFYTADDRARERKRFARALIAGIACVFAGIICLLALGEDPRAEHIGLCLLLLFIAGGAFLIVRYGMLLGRTNIAEYNKSAVEELEVEDIVNAQLDEARREALLDRKKGGRKLGAVCGVIMIAATIVGLAALFAPVLASPNPDSFEPEGTSAMWFWVAWPIGGTLCGIVTLIWEAFRKGE